MCYIHRLTSLLLLFTVLISAISGIIVNPGDVIGEGNCAGSIDTYLCTCLASNTTSTIDIQLSPGVYYLSQQPSCALWNKTGITITGSPSNDTIIKCINGFSIKFYNTQNIVIRNLVMIGCGNITFTGNQSFIGQYLFYFDGIGNVNVNHLYLSNTVGYGIIIANYHGTPQNIELLDVHITDTIYTVSDDCNCSGSGIFIIYDNQINEKCNISTIKIDNCSFINNTNILPTDQYKKFLGVANTGYKRNNRLPLVGAACISILDAQYNLNVTTEISNTQFYKNSGTFSASVALVVADSTKSKVVIENCTFDNNRGIYKSSGNDPTTGGIYFINLGKGVSTNNEVEAEVLTVVRSNFTNLVGTLGVAFHIEKNSPDSVLVIIKIEECNFTRNRADSGSAIFAKDRSSSLSYRPVVGGSLNIYLTNINADNNMLNGSINNVTNNFITGIFHISNCLVMLTCDEQCHFQYNQPSVFYGHRSALTINGKVSFMNNTAIYGGAVRLLDTVLYISTNTTAHFVNNSAMANGGAIKVEFAVTNIQSQDNCPIQFVGLPPQLTITDDNFTEISTSMDIDVLFQGNHARNRPNSIFANVFYVCSWYPDTSVLTQQLGPNSKVNESGLRYAVYREAVYHEAFNYSNGSIRDHLNISAIVPCVCDDADDFSYNVIKCLDQNESIYFPEKVIPGRPFVINITPLDTVGSVGYSSQLVINAYNSNSTSEQRLALNDQEVEITREFSVGNQSCVEVDFTIYIHTEDKPLLNGTKGSLTLSVAIPRFITISFDFVDQCFREVLEEDAQTQGKKVDKYLLFS